MKKETFKSATNILNDRQHIQNTLNQIAKSSGKDFAFFDKNGAKFTSDSMDIMLKISNLLDNLGIKYNHHSKDLHSVPELIIAQEYVDVAHKLFDGWQSNTMIEKDPRIENIEWLINEGR